MADEWQMIESNRIFWNPEKPGEELIGKLVTIGDGAYGKEFTLKVTKDSKEQDVKLPAHKMLQGLCSSLVLGDEVKVVFTGTQPPKVKGESPLRVYQLFRKMPVTEEKVQ